MQTRTAVAAGIVATAGILTGFFFVFNFLFSDGPMSPLHSERLVTYALVLAGAFIPSLLGTRFGAATTSYKWALLAAGPGLVIALLFMVGGLVGGEASLMILPTLYALCEAAGGWDGAWAGLKWAAAARATSD